MLAAGSFFPKSLVPSCSEPDLLTPVLCPRFFAPCLKEEKEKRPLFWTASLRRCQKNKLNLVSEETINKDVDFDQDKLCSKLLSIVSRENRYANSVLELMKIKQQFYVNAFTTITAELPNLEGMLRDTQMRPIFGEDLDDHLRACRRKIAKPIALSVKSLREGGLTDEGLFRIPTKQIKLDKVKAFMDYNMPLQHVLQVSLALNLQKNLKD